MYFEAYKSGSDYRWRLKAANHEIVASGEGYTTAAARDHGIACLKRTDANTPVHNR